MESPEQPKIPNGVDVKYKSVPVDPVVAVFWATQAAYVSQWPYDSSVYLLRNASLQQVALLVSLQQVTSLLAYVFPWPWGRRQRLVTVCLLLGFVSSTIKIFGLFFTAAVLQGFCIGTVMAVLDLRQSVQQASGYQKHVAMISWTLVSFVVDISSFSPEAIYIMSGYLYLNAAAGAHFWLEDKDFFAAQPLLPSSRRVEAWGHCLVYHLENALLAVTSVSRTCIEATGVVSLATFPVLARETCSDIMPSVSALMVLRMMMQAAATFFIAILAVSQQWWRFVQFGGCITCFVGILLVYNAQRPVEACCGYMVLSYGATQAGAGQLRTWPALAGGFLAAGVLAWPASDDEQQFQAAINRTATLLCFAAASLLTILGMTFCARYKRRVRGASCDALVQR